MPQYSLKKISTLIGLNKCMLLENLHKKENKTKLKYLNQLDIPQNSLLTISKS